MTLAAGHDLGAVGEGVSDVLFDLGDGSHIDERPLHHTVLGAIADLHRRNFRRQLLDKRIVDLVLGVDAIGADAGLPHVAVFRDNRAIDRGIEIGVVEHDEGCIAAKLEAELFHANRRLLIEDLADFG